MLLSHNAVLSVKYICLPHSKAIPHCDGTTDVMHSKSSPPSVSPDSHDCTSLNNTAPKNCFLWCSEA